MLLKIFSKQTGKLKVFHSGSSWLGTILLHLSDVNILEDYQAHSSDRSLSLYHLYLLKFIRNAQATSTDSVLSCEVFEAPQLSY